MKSLRDEPHKKDGISESDLLEHYSVTLEETYYTINAHDTCLTVVQTWTEIDDIVFLLLPSHDM